MVESMQVPGLGIPLPEGMMILLLLLAGFRPPRRDLSRYGLLTVVILGLLAYLVAVTLVQDLDPARRAIRIGLLMLFAYALASERIDIKSILYGMAAGGLVNVPLFYAGLVPDNYGGYLTGWLADKNVAGLFYALIPVLLVATMQRMGPKLLVLGVGFLLVFLTGSRTSLAALGCAVVWILLSPYLGRVLRLVLVAGMARFVGWAEEYLADAAIFGDRSGTDWFRDRIQAESARMVDAAPWYGEGLGTAQVHLDNVTMFFHNSYLALLIEGGWPFLIVVVGLYVALSLRPFAATHRSPSRVAVEAAAVIILVASTQLGEVFITIYGVIVVAAGLLLTAQEADEKDGLTAAERARQRRVGRVMARARRAEGRPVGARQP
ncbi:hypothetical protein [Micrococcus sp.]|uniref:hypothetical protein n=1 Tax=Micrococcus sp. TaxID=1271 RepID=UPI002A913A08|nr:hypothetical protein [Micrococcus sp.]